MYGDDDVGDDNVDPRLTSRGDLFQGIVYAIYAITLQRSKPCTRILACNVL